MSKSIKILLFVLYYTEERQSMSINVGFANGKRLWFWHLCALFDNGAVFSVCEAFCQCRVSHVAQKDLVQQR